MNHDGISLQLSPQLNYLYFPQKSDLKNISYPKEYYISAIGKTKGCSAERITNEANYIISRFNLIIENEMTKLMLTMIKMSSTLFVYKMPLRGLNEEF